MYQGNFYLPSASPSRHYMLQHMIIPPKNSSLSKQLRTARHDHERNCIAHAARSRPATWPPPSACRNAPGWRYAGRVSSSSSSITVTLPLQCLGSPSLARLNISLRCQFIRYCCLFNPPFSYGVQERSRVGRAGPTWYAGEFRGGKRSGRGLGLWLSEDGFQEGLYEGEWDQVFFLFILNYPSLFLTNSSTRVSATVLARTDSTTASTNMRANGLWTKCTVADAS